MYEITCNYGLFITNIIPKHLQNIFMEMYDILNIQNWRRVSYNIILCKIKIILVWYNSVSVFSYIQIVCTNYGIKVYFILYICEQGTVLHRARLQTIWVSQPIHKVQNTKSAVHMSTYVRSPRIFQTISPGGIKQKYIISLRLDSVFHIVILYLWIRPLRTKL